MTKFKGQRCEILRKKTGFLRAVNELNFVSLKKEIISRLITISLIDSNQSHAAVRLKFLSCFLCLKLVDLNEVQNSINFHEETKEKRFLGRWKRENKAKIYLI